MILFEKKEKTKYFFDMFQFVHFLDIFGQQSSEVQYIKNMFLNIRNHSTHITDHGSNLQMKFISIRMFVTQPNMSIYLYIELIHRYY